MSVDKFGRHEGTFASEMLRGPPGEGFQLTQSGNYDLKRKRLCNLADPLITEDAVNLKTLQTLTLHCDTHDGYFDAKGKKIGNIGTANADTDAVNRGFILQEIGKLKNILNDRIDMLSSNIFNIVSINKDTNELSAKDGYYVYTTSSETEESLPHLTSSEPSK